MKKIYLALALLAALSVVSCVKDPFEENGNGQSALSKKGIAFVFSGAQTRSAGVAEEARTGISIPMANSGYYLTETVSDIDACEPVTKGSPIYNENVLTVTGYQSIDVVTYLAGQGGAAHTAGNATFEVGEGQTDRIYSHVYPTSPWPDATTDLYFYLKMPAGDTCAKAFTYDPADGKITFNYTSPSTAVAQKDILFSSRTLNRDEYYANYLTQGKGAPVTMYHALSGVRFRSSCSNENQTKTIITNVEFSGLLKSGTCTVNPAAEGTTPKVTWTAVKDTGSFKVSDAGYSNPEYIKENGADNLDGTIDFNAADKKFGDSWYAAGSMDHNLNNLNDEAGSLTFWFIPQAINENVKLKVTFVIKTPDTVEGIPFEHEIALGEILHAAGVEWKAGQIRTYTLDPSAVDVMISDKLTADKKSGLHVTNTGNVDEYVRMLIMGNWYGWKPGQSHSEEPNILVGYKYPSKAAAVAAGEPDDPMVLPWYREGYPYVVVDGENVYYATEAEAKQHGWPEHGPYGDPYGSFDSSFTLANLGARDGASYDWADASGGFYYTMPIGPGKDIEEVNALSKDLFETYTVTAVPQIYVATVGDQRGLAEGVHLVMEIVVQAIAVPKVTDTTSPNYDKDVWWLEAWYKATKVEKLNPLNMKGGAYRNLKYLQKYNAGAYAPTVYGEYEVPASVGTGE